MRAVTNSEQPSPDRRRFVQALAVGATVVTVGGIAYVVAGGEEAGAGLRPDGRRRLPPGQRALVPKPEDAAGNDVPVAEPPKPKLIRVDATTKREQRIPPEQYTLDALRPMGGTPGDPSRGSLTLRVYGEVEKELSLGFDDLLDGFTRIEQTCDVHCVTKWSLLGGIWQGVRVSELAERAKVNKRARHVIFESHAGYTANVDIDEAMKPNVLVAWDINGAPIGGAHGAPLRSLVPDRYFWKSAKWLTGIRFVEKDVRGYWEVRGYHNHADPWKEERYSSQE